MPGLPGNSFYQAVLIKVDNGHNCIEFGTIKLNSCKSSRFNADSGEPGFLLFTFLKCILSSFKRIYIYSNVFLLFILFLLILQDLVTICNKNELFAHEPTTGDKGGVDGVVDSSMLKQNVSKSYIFSFFDYFR